MEYILLIIGFVLLVKGAVPGANKGLLIIRDTVK